ncbi:MAG: DEAD/DEAH box helicase, partial [Actinobacteria bacterium]|nr:DEAD/DEAH box helicase [Actinomycetota bacterium]
SRLVDEALAVWARPGFDTFMCLQRLRFEPFPYQLETAARVLRQMQGRAILADEVGLGKTIEAGLVLSELRLRGLADQALVLVPAGLVEQWREELELKFGLPVHVPAAGARDLDGARGGEIVLASLAAARRAPLREAITRPSWDLVVVDEAHRLKNQRSASARLARSLRARYMLLLTATPVENRLSDLFALVSLLRPGSLGTASEFRARHAARGDGQVARNIVDLQRSLRDVMVRHRRSELKTILPRRLAETVRVEPAPAEAELYRLVSERVRQAARERGPGNLLALRGVQRAAGSSSGALAPSIARLGWPDLAARAREVGVTGKVQALLTILDRHRQSGEKVVVFTAFRATLELLGEHVARHGLSAVSYHGGLPRAQKDAVIDAFRHDAQILLSTEAAGEGRNLQFCHVMVNFDLPWNPMQIEQRLGRIHRVGQEHDVMLTNLVARDTIEERILQVLQAKINLFELVVGELDMIL